MSEINVQLKDGTAIQVPSSTTVAEALKRLDRDLAKQALAAKALLSNPISSNVNRKS